uniref:DUF1640 domain-containing protein n=1 Tax=Candidatus Kentrum sp. TC TaxID=2126339 RepID=A0A450Z485_9GAMM|nr:MAG: hypothetical protein BECKTC1821D_GA0114238_106215 [Candidatus Kentron sp. TC]
MTDIPFDTHEFVETLREAGKDALSKAAFATKADIERLTSNIDQLRSITRADIEQLRSATKANIDRLRSEMRLEMREMEHRLTIRMGAMFITTIALLTALDKLL